jgi:hypothetical protein
MDIPSNMRDAKRRVEHELLSRPGVTGVDIGYKEVGGVPTDQLAIRVLVADKKDVPKAQQVPKEIDGHPTDVIERRFELHQLASRVKEDKLELQADTGTYDPLKGGCSLGPCRAVGGYVYVGTLGAIVRDNSTGRPLMLSNFHVMCIDNGWSAGDQMAQPGRNDGGTCPANVVGGILRASLGGTVDCAVADITASRGNACEIIDIGPINGTDVASMGLAVRKRGRTTGLTYGTVDSVDLTVSIDYGDGLGMQTLLHQIGVKPDPTHSAKFSDHGDSGAVVVNSGGKVVGLNFAGDDTGYGIANPIADVFAALGISMCTSKSLIKELKEIPKEHKEAKLEKLEFKEHKPEKYEIKEIKHEKLEKLEQKFEHKEIKLEKFEHKEIKLEKLEHPEKDFRSEFEDPKRSEGDPFQPGFPFGPGMPGFGGMAMGGTVGAAGTTPGPHFISRELRPDLSRGALSREPDVRDF